MIKIERLFEAQFDDQSIGRFTFRKFAQDHIRRLITQNKDGVFDGMIQDTQAAHDRFFSAINDLDSNTSKRQGRTIATNVLLVSFKQKISACEGFISYRLGKGSARYEEFFPQGLSEYSTATMENVETLMTRFVQAALTYSGKLGPDLHTEFNALLDSYKAARDTQLSQKGMVNGSINEADTTRSVIEMQLTKNLYQLAIMYLGNPDAATMFFDQSIIRTAGSNDNAQENDDAVHIDAPAPAMSAAV